MVVSKEYPHMHDNSRLLPDLILWTIGMLVDVVITQPGGTDAIDVTDPDRRVITVPDTVPDRQVITVPDTVPDRQVITGPDTVPDRRVIAAGRVHGHAATTQERAKESKYRKTALQCALQVKGFSMEAYGCLGPSAQAVIDAIVRAVSQKKECPYSPQEFRQLLRGSLQAALARGNALILQQAERRRLMRLMRSEQQNG